jgi:hypothetical protein
MSKKRFLKMPRPRKYDYQNDYPVKLFIKVPVKTMNILEEKGLTNSDIEKLVEKYLAEYAEKLGK